MDNDLLSLHVISESILKEAAKAHPEEKDNSFIYALDAGRVFKENDLSPVYLFDQHSKSIFVTSKERIKKMFH